MEIKPEQNPNKLDFNDHSPEAQGERGRKAKGKPKPFALNKKRNCNTKCPLFDRCLFQLESSNYNNKCGLANSDKTTSRRKHRIIRTLLGGKGEIINILRELAVEMDTIRESKNFIELEKLFTNYIKLLDTEFGKIEKIEHSGIIKGQIWTEKAVYDKIFKNKDKKE